MSELGEAMTGAFTEAGAAGRDFDRVAEALGGTLVTAFRGAAFEGKSFRELLLKIVQVVLVLSQSSTGGGGIQSRDAVRWDNQLKKMNARITTARKPLTTRLLARVRDIRPQDGHMSPAGFICLPQSGQEMSAISC